jgi:hypothetical protein
VAGGGGVGEARGGSIKGFGAIAGLRADAGAVDVTLRAGAGVDSSGAPFGRARFGGGSTTQENGNSTTVGRGSKGTNGVAVAEETSRLINGGGTGGQLPPAGGDISPGGEIASFARGGV